MNDAQADGIAAAGDSRVVVAPATRRFPYAIRDHDSGDESELLNLLQLTVGETAASRKTSDFWHWKHRLNPFGESYSVCAWDEENSSVARLAGLRTLMHWSLRSPHGTRYDAARPVDTATHPEHQRRGIFSALTRFAIADLENRGTSFIFNTPNSNSLPGYVKMGWQRVARWPVYIRPIRVLRVGRRLVARRSSASPPSRGGTSDAALVPWRKFLDEHGNDFEELVSRHERLRTHVGYRTERSLAYLNWRYGSHPEVEYGVLPAFDDQGLWGAVVAREVRGVLGLRALTVTEMFLRMPTAQMGSRIVGTLARATSCDYLAAHFSVGTIERRALFRSGFLPVPGRGYTFAARALNPVPLDPTKPTSWDLSLGELEIF